MIWRGVVFRDFDATGLDGFEVCTAEGVVTTSNLSDEMTPYQARMVANMLVAAANEIESL